MSYVTQNFEDGKVLKAEHLNYIERNLVGIAKNSDKVPGKANAFVAETSGDAVTFYPDEGSPLGVTAHIEPVQAGSGDPYPGGGGKNLLPNTAKTQTVNGVTFTVNADGSITANGTATGTVTYNIGFPVLMAGSYVISGGVSGVSVILRRKKADGTYGYTSTQNSTETQVVLDGTENELYVYAQISSGVTVSGATLKPMIRLASVTDATYAPYSNIRPISGHTGCDVTRSGKNLVSESSASGALSAYNKVLYIKSELMPNTTYTLSFVASRAGNNLYLNEYISEHQYFDTTGERQSITFTTAKEVTKNNAARYDMELGWIIFKNGITNTEPVTFSDVQLELGSTATPFEPYQGANTYVMDFGRNLAEQIVYGYVTIDGSNANVRIDNNSTAAIAKVIEGNEYTISCEAAFDRFGIGKLETAAATDGAPLTGYKFYGNQSSVHELHFTAEFTGIAFIYLKSTKDGTAKDSLQIELGSTATEYSPYNSAILAQTGGMVYGGTVDCDTGVLTVEWAMITFNGSENVQHSNGGVGRFVFYGLQSTIKPFSDSTTVAQIVCSHYKSSTADYLYNAPDVYAIAQNNGGEIWFSDTGFDDTDGFKSYLAAQKAAGTPVQVCYKLATPTTIQLTPQEILALKGSNTVYTNAGPVTVEYNKSLSKAFEEVLAKLAALEAAAVNNV